MRTNVSASFAYERVAAICQVDQGSSAGKASDALLARNNSEVIKIGLNTQKTKVFSRWKPGSGLTAVLKAERCEVWPAERT